MIKQASDKQYVTYMRYPDTFDKGKIVSNIVPHNPNRKPGRVWWGSPVDATFGWAEWCEQEEYGNYDFSRPILWHLKPEAKVFEIDWDEVSNPESALSGYIIYVDYIDFAKMRYDGIAAVELMDACIGHAYINHTEVIFNGWDCESIAILDPSMIVFDNI